MPYYAKSEDWLHQSALLLQARPSTTKVTTRYHLKPARRLPKPPKSTNPDAATAPTKPSPPQPEGDAPQQKPTRGHLVLRTYDPASGVALKYKTSKAAEVTRLVQMLGTLGRGMAGVGGAVSEQQGQDEVMVDVGGGREGEGVAAAGSGVATPVGGGGAQQGQPQQQGPGQGGGGGGKGKKKKGKR